MRTSELTDADFIEIAQIERSAQSGSSSFTLETEDYGVARIGFHTTGGECKGVSLAVETAPSITHDHEVYFDGDTAYAFPEQHSEVIQNLVGLRKLPHPPVPYGERVFDDGRARYVSPIGAAALIRSVVDRDPSRVMFFTGAGVSLGGDVPIFDHSHLLEGLGISEEVDSKARAQNNTFCERFITENGYAKRVFTMFNNSFEHFYVDASTPAHCAIAGMVRAMHHEPMILTTNHDLKHESRGSRLQAVKVPPYWHSDNCRRPDLTPIVREALQEHKGAVDLMVVVGMRRDYRRLLEGFRHTNERFRVLSINYDQQPQPYLGPDDYYLRGNAQETLPDVAEIFLAQS